MNQVVFMLQESNKRMNMIMSNKFNGEQISAAQREFEDQIKLANVVIQAYAVSSKNRRALKGLENMNIMDDTTAVDLGLSPPELDKVKCLIRNGDLIYRSECLDLNGTKANFDTCKNCQNKGNTNRMLCDGK